jgi:hypothetical protein
MMLGVAKRGDGQQDRTDAGEQDDKCDRKRRKGNAVCPDQHHVGADKLEQRVIQIVLECILTPEHVAHICAELQDRLGGSRLEEQIAELDGRIVGVKRSLACLTTNPTPVAIPFRGQEFVSSLPGIGPAAATGAAARCCAAFFVIAPPSQAKSFSQAACHGCRERSDGSLSARRQDLLDLRWSISV